jgi:hypothetical protein
MFTADLPFADVELASETRAMLAHVRRYTVRNFGPRCLDFEPECACCAQWARYDNMAKSLDFCCE